MKLMKMQQIEVERMDAGDLQYEKGRAVKNPTTTFSLKASVQPADADKISQLPEGDRGSSVIAIFTVEPLLKRDRVNYKGVWHTVLYSADWGIPGLRCAHNMALATTEDFTR